jgi:hypothetical protein
MAEQKTTDEQKAPGCFLCLNVKPLIENLWSETTRSHFRNSRIEFLKGIRSVIDDRIAKMSRAERRGHNGNGGLISGGGRRRPAGVPRTPGRGDLRSLRRGG